MEDSVQTESAYEAERRQRILANQQKLRALGLGCGASTALPAHDTGPLRGPNVQRKRARPTEQARVWYGNVFQAPR